MSVLVVPDKKALIVASHNRDEILSVIPNAKPARDNLVVLPHGEDEAKVLRNMGYSVPEPIRHYYRWPGKHKPMSHQFDTAAFLTAHRKCLVLNDMGTGKTLSAIWAADYLMTIGAIKRVLIISPMSTMEETWGKSIFLTLTNRTYAILHGTAQKRRKLLGEGTDFCIVNHDGFEIIAKDSQGLFDLVIYDEADALKNPGTDRFKFFRRFMDANPDCRLWLMTGTPTPNEPTDAWALAKLIGNPHLDKSYTAFRDRVMIKVGQWRFSPRPDSPETVAKVLSPSVRFKREDCVDLPEVIYHSRKVELSEEQSKAYKAMMKHLVVEAKAGDITAANEAVKAQKLVQIACGVAYNEHGDPVEIPCAPRVNELITCLEQVNGKAIVFVPLTAVQAMLQRVLAKKGYRVAVVNGATTFNQRSEIFREFQDGTKVDVILAHPATMSHGLTLTSARAIIWYAPINSSGQYTQANARTERIGKKHVTLLIHLYATDLEQRMFTRLKSKQKMQGVLLDILGGQP